MRTRTNGSIFKRLFWWKGRADSEEVPLGDADCLLGKPLAQEVGASIKRQIAAGAPEPDQCLAVRVSPDREPAWCLAEQGRKCQFARGFGVALICTHTDRELIVARTEAREAAELGGQREAGPAGPDNPGKHNKRT